MKELLIVEDDRALGEGIRLALRGGELTPRLCGSIAQGRAALAEGRVALAVLDINLPDGSGLDLLADIRRGGPLPVLLLTANDMESDIVTGLESGADDYITKPFSLAVLRARVNAQLRKAAAPARFEQGDFIFDFDRMEFYKNDAPVELSKTEQKLLRLLVQNRGITLSRADLVDRVWSDGAEYVDENALSVAIKRLRDKLEDTPGKPQHLKTVYGVGYTWAVT